MGLSLKDREWKEFLFPYIFEIKKGFYNKKPTSTGKGKIPFLGATANNNGVTQFNTLEEIENGSRLGFGNNEQIANKVFSGNCIAVTNNGSVGHAYYQYLDFTCSHDINPLYLINKELNRYIAFFLISAIEKQKVCFEYARKWRPMRMVKSKLLLPTTPKGEPDYDFMEQYMREQEVIKQAKYKAYITKRLKELKSDNEVEPLNSKEWKEFFIEDIFNINSGVRLTKASMRRGTLPFIGASDSNNGITEFVSNTNKSLDYNVLGVNYNGSVVENFFHPYKAVFSDDVKRLSLKSRQGNKFIYLFVKALILQQKNKYEYGYKFNGERMARQKIMLPINSNNEPDYEYMEQYMKSLEYKKIKKHLDWKK